MLVRLAFPSTISLFILFGLTYAALVCRYVVVALVFYFYPGTPLDGLLKACPA